MLSGCVPITLPPRPDVIIAPTPVHFSVCYGYSCRNIATLALDDAQLHTFDLLLGKDPGDAASERRQLAAAIAAMEIWVGTHTGTSKDVGGTFPGLGQPGQMDCIDESTNTTTYLKIFAAHGWLRHHTVEPRMARGFIPWSWPHTSAVIRDIDTGQRYAVDSWFLDNGQAPFIVPLETWKDGWKPPQ